MRSLSERITARRQERSYMVTIAAWANNPDMAVRIANALAKAFQEEVAQAEADGAGRAASALTDRLAELKQSASDAEAKVAEFKRDHGLQTSAGELISSQSMAQINVKLVDANARLVEAQSRYNELTASTPSQTSRRRHCSRPRSPACAPNMRRSSRRSIPCRSPTGRVIPD